ncbi:mas-related G-protein coupled receptor member H-like [Carettochelys insculpta]|uniref:mas-related G-protein coupled receptor member H-like n=1 Tax=Carettochelys insculpta TaxID=44489 RepID=UPI003EB9AD1D
MTELRTTFCPSAETSLGNRIEYNGTDFKTDHLTPIIIGITLLFCIFGLVGNGIVFWFLGFHIRRNPFTIYVLNLAAADFGCLLCLATFFTIYSIGSLFYFSSELFFSQRAFNIMVLFLYSTSLYLLTAISTERCVSVLFPIWHRCHRPKRLSAIVCALLWALSCLLTGLACNDCVLNSYERCNMMLTPLSVTNFLIFPPIMFVSSLTLFIKVRCSSQRRQPGKLYIVILLTVLFFLFFAVPLSIVTFLQNLGNLFKIIIISFMLASINSSINPAIYFLVGSYRNQQLRGSIKHTLQRVFEDKADSREDRTSVTAT